MFAKDPKLTRSIIRILRILRAGRIIDEMLCDLGGVAVAVESTGNRARHTDLFWWQRTTTGRYYYRE